MKNIALRLKAPALAVLSISSLLPLVSKTEAYEFPNLKVHAYTYYGAVNNAEYLSAGRQLLSSLADQKNAVYGVSASFSYYWTRYNSAWAAKYNINGLTLGPELLYNFIKSQEKDSKDHIYNKKANSLSLGIASRYYINDAIFLKATVGLNLTSTKIKDLNTFSKVSNTFTSLFTKGKASSLGPYATLAIGFDLETVTTNLSFSYFHPKTDLPAYRTIVLGVGWNFAF